MGCLARGGKGRLLELKHMMPYLLAILAGIAAFAGYKDWPLFFIPVVGIAFVIWNFLYFGTGGLRIATGGPIAYLIRLFVINVIQAGALYAIGRGINWLIG